MPIEIAIINSIPINLAALKQTVKQQNTLAEGSPIRDRHQGNGTILQWLLLFIAIFNKTDFTLP